jgi:hypothetical protein
MSIRKEIDIPKNAQIKPFLTSTKQRSETVMEKSLVLSISAGVGCYRHIQISEEMTLYKLHETMLDLFDFWDDHMHAFFMNNRAWDGAEEYICPGSDLDCARGFSNKVKLSKFHLQRGDKFLYIFDFGDGWRFQIKVLRVVNEPTESPIILKNVGRISQYGDCDEDGDF